MKIKWKIALPVLVLMLLTTVLTTTIGYFIIKNSVDTMMANDVESNLDTLVNQVERANETEKIMISEMDRKNLSFARLFVESIRLNGINGALNLDDVTYYQNLAASLKVTELDIADSNGSIIASNFAENYGFNYGSTDTTNMYLNILKDSKIEIVEAPRASVVSGDMHQYVGVARTDERGFVQIGFDANAVKELHNYLDVMRTAADMRVGLSGHASILQGGIIMYSKYSEKIGRDVNDAAWYKNISSGRGKSWINIDGENMYAGFANIGGMTLLVLFPQKEYNDYIAPIRIVGITGALIALLVTLLIYFQVSRISVPISELAVAAGKIANGELDVRFKQVNGNDEVSFLSLKMQEMTRRLNEARQMELESIHIRHEKEKAEESNRAKTSFLAMISHEIRTPINAIIGIAQIQLQKKDLPDEQKIAMEQMYSSGSILLGIINDILDMSKIETGKMELIPKEYDVPSLIHDTVQLNMVRIGAKSIKFILDISKTLPAKMLGDELRLKQILNNLLSNAIKYTEKGYVKLSVNHSVQNDNIILYFIIEDTGQGIKPQDREKLFSRYLRFNMEANRTTEGAGIGLHITKNLVNLMDGTIEVESESGKGSIFTVVLKQKAIKCAAIGSEIAERLNNFTFSEEKQYKETNLLRELMPYGKVLIVDDMATNLYVAKGLMANYKLKIETVGSGFMAIDKIKNGNVYDIIFMDHMMPMMDGIETVQKIRALGYNGAIVALTANALIGNDEMFLQNGFDGFISKPIDAERLNTVLNEFIRDRHSKEAKKHTLEIAAEKPPEINPKLLQIFRSDAEKAIATLRETTASGDIKLFTTTVHAMKSALANVGEHEASALALALEKAGNSGNMPFIFANTKHFIETLEVLNKKFTPADTAGEAEAQVIEDVDFLKEQMQIFKTACENYDDDAAYAALDRLMKKKWRPKTASALEQMRDTLFLHSDFDKAVKMAREIME